MKELSELFRSWTPHLIGMTDDADDGSGKTGGDKDGDSIREKLEEKVEQGRQERDDDLPEPLEDEGSDGDLSSQDSGGFSMLSNQLPVADNLMDTGVMRMMRLLNQQMQEVLEVLKEHREEVREVIETTIDLEKPEEYDPEESEVHEKAEAVAAKQLRNMFYALEDVDDSDLKRVRSRLAVGYDAYVGYVPAGDNADDGPVDVQPRIHEAIFVFTSLQDALMYRLCDRDSSVDYDNSNLETYTSRTKKRVLKDRYTSYHGIAPNSLFDDNLDAFYKHRHSIMHGDFDAHFDENIATASVLFFVLTLHTVLEELEKSTDYERYDLDFSE